MTNVKTNAQQERNITGRRVYFSMALLLLFINAADVRAQIAGDSVRVIYPDGATTITKTNGAPKDSIISPDDAPFIVDKPNWGDVEVRKTTRDWSKWQPEPKRALWLALVLPGAGQVYNRKYWKLPLLYGGFVGCVYAMTWNNQMYHDYSQAYKDIMDNDPTTQSYNNFLHLGNTINPSNLERYQQLFKRRKDRYRRWRDMSIFATIGVYLLSVIDAYVDASLSDFDISNDLSLHIAPAVINTKQSMGLKQNTAIGITCSLTF